jgi:hypothetical protein
MAASWRATSLAVVAVRARLPATLAAMRRPLLLALLAALVAGLSVTAVSLAGSRDADRTDRVERSVCADRSERSERAGRAARAHGGGAHAAIRRQVLASLARRLDVTPAQLRAALRTVKRENRRTTFPPQSEWAALKLKLAEDLGAELDRSPDAVLAAVRAELSAKLDLAVTFGAVTARGRELALACFDDPASCDVAALRGEVRFRHGR